MLSKFRLLKEESGQAIVLLALVFTLLCGLAALSIDVGYMALAKAELQNAADAAVMAAAQELPDNPDQAITCAQAYANVNGESSDDVRVTIGEDNKSISVAINRTVPMSFANILGTKAADLSADATAKTGIAASVPWIVPFVIPKPPQFNYDEVYVMRMYGPGNFIDYPNANGSTPAGYPPGYKYPYDWRADPIYGRYTLSNPYPYQFDYMNVYIEKNTNFSDYINWLENGYHDTFSINQQMYYYAPSSGGRESVNAFARRVERDSNTDYTKAKVGDGRVILIPIVDKILSRNTSQRGNIPVTIIGFAGFFIQEVHKNSYGTSFWFEGRFLEDLNIGTGEVTFDSNADFGLRVVKLTD